MSATHCTPCHSADGCSKLAPNYLLVMSHVSAPTTIPSVTVIPVDRDELNEMIRDAVAEALASLSIGQSEPVGTTVDGDEMARRLSISRSTLDRMRSDGKIPSVGLNRTVRYDPVAVLAAVSDAQ